MKVKRKSTGAKAQVRAEKERERCTATAIFLAIVLIVVVLSAYLTYAFLNQPQNPTINPAYSKPKAALVDQLSLTFPNQTFANTVINILKQAGYSVDYYSGKEVTVDFYASLPTRGYEIIILRVHSSVYSSLRGDMSPPTTLFTSELYSTNKYVLEQLAGQVGRACFSPYREGDPTYFSVLPYFVTQRMSGSFKNSTIIVMGCNGLKYDDLATTFIEKGARIYISWDDSVTAAHTDQATAELLRNMLIERQTVETAINNTMEKIGPDPEYKSRLTYYP